MGNNKKCFGYILELVQNKITGNTQTRYEAILKILVRDLKKLTSNVYNHLILSPQMISAKQLKSRKNFHPFTIIQTTSSPHTLQKLWRERIITI